VFSPNPVVNINGDCLTSEQQVVYGAGSLSFQACLDSLISYANKKSNELDCESIQTLHIKQHHALGDIETIEHRGDSSWRSSASCTKARLGVLYIIEAAIGRNTG